ncbi:unnamed protein product [Effrenium voratum]|nr:unnamed protein product [Effrenium voratum]
MCVAWTSMRLARCLIMIPISENACILILTAFAMTPVAGLLLIVADKLADGRVISDHLADTLVTSYGFMIGFSWEKAYAAASHLLMDNVLTSKDQESGNMSGRFSNEFLFSCALCFALVCVMFPGWRFLILPYGLRPMPPRDHALAKSPE